MFIPDRTFWESVNFQPSKILKKRGKSIVFSAHCGGLTLGNSLGAFRHKQDLHRREHQPKVFDHGHVVDVHQVHLELVVGLRVVAAVDLGVARETGLYLQAQGEGWHFFFVLI